jgi:hypothetical protein
MKNELPEFPMLLTQDNVMVTRNDDGGWSMHVSISEKSMRSISQEKLSAFLLEFVSMLPRQTDSASGN